MDTNNQFDDECISDVPSIEKEYYCREMVKSAGFTLLMKLVLLTKKKKKAIYLIRKILNKNPNTIDKKNDKGWTALMLAVRNSNTCSTENTVKILIDAGADLNLQSNIGATALGHSENHCENNIFKMLINAGVGINLQNNNGMSVLMGVIRSDNSNTCRVEKVKILLDTGVDINLQNKRGNTALMLSSNIKSCDETIIQLLIDAGADINLQNNDDQTALDLAEKYCDTPSTTRTVELLTEAKMFFINSQTIKG